MCMCSENTVTYGPMVIVLHVHASVITFSATTKVSGDVIVLFSSSLQQQKLC